jgi:hypothetical protein
MDFVDSLELEIERLAKVVDAIPEVRQLQELRRLRGLYISPIQKQLEVAIAGAAGVDRSAVVIKSAAGRKMAPERQKAIDVTKRLLEGQKEPMKTAELLEYLKMTGVDLSGSDPVNSLSALLSTSGLFQAHGRSGWTLKPVNDEIAPRGPTFEEMIADASETESGTTLDGSNEPLKRRL